MIGFQRGVLALAALGASAGAALTQQSAVEACRAMPTDAERIACLEAALSAKSAPQAAPEPERRGGGLRLPSIPFIGGGGDDRAPAASAAPAASLGAEQVAVRNGDFPRAGHDAERVSANVASVEEDARGMLVFNLDNGQVWRQTEQPSLPVRVGSEAQPVEITSSGFGGYRMQLTSPDRRIKVERLQ